MCVVYIVVVTMQKWTNVECMRMKCKWKVNCLPQRGERACIWLKEEQDLVQSGGERGKKGEL